MSHRLSALNRVIALIIGLVLLGAAGWLIAWDVGIPFVRERVATIDRPQIVDVPNQPWWTTALVITMIGAFVFGACLLYLNLSRRHSPTAQIHDPDTHGILSVDLRPIARSIAAELRRHPGIQRAHGRAVLERGRPTLTIVVAVQPDIDLTGFTAHAEDIAAQLTRCLDGEHVATQVLVHFDTPAHS